jgi:hypothetical protein
VSDHAQNALDPAIVAEVLFRVMGEGWFRQGQILGKYCNATADNPYGAREIINGDKAIQVEEPLPPPEPEFEATVIRLSITAPKGAVTVTVERGGMIRNSTRKSST